MVPEGGISLEVFKMFFRCKIPFTDSYENWIARAQTGDLFYAICDCDDNFLQK
jgi:hypothetical protein